MIISFLGSCYVDKTENHNAIKRNPFADWPDIQSILLDQLSPQNHSFGIPNLSVMSKPNVLVLGGMGFIGRNMVQYLVENDLANQIRSVDKVLASTANLGAGHAEAFNAANVEAMQANLTSEGAWLFIIFFIFFLTFCFLSWYQESLYSKRRK